MTPLATRLDDVDFDALMAIARRSLPALAREWTDYNYHDPGITLIELLAWVADSQVYSLARNRHDERLAMGRLLGVTPRGANPARGIVYPTSTPAAVQLIKADSVLNPAADPAPRMETTADVTLLPIEIRRVATCAADGSIIDLTATNARQRASFLPFGDDGAGELWIELKASALASGGDLSLSVGVELDGDPRNGSDLVPNLGELAVTDSSGRPLRLLLDTSCGLQRSGVWIVALTSDQMKQRIIVRRASGYPLRPRVVQISLNALPVEQRATLRNANNGNNAKRLLDGGPGPEMSFIPAAAFDPDEQVEARTWRLVDGDSAFQVKVAAERDWKRGRLDDAGPQDRRYSLDEQPDGSGIRVRFGNGVNGQLPRQDDPIELTATLSCGTGGNVGKPIEWQLDRYQLRLRNHFAIGGGRDAEDVSDALRRASARLREGRVLASAKQLTNALKPLMTPLEIARADVEEGWESGRRKPSVSATRTLLVANERPGSETPEWLRTIKRSLTPRIAIGERLIVQPPKYVPFSVSVVVYAATGSAPRSVEKAIRDELHNRLVDSPKKWPLGRDVDASAVAGWVRTVDGVASVVDLKVVVDGSGRDHLDISRGMLPQFNEPADVTVKERPR